MAYNVKYNWLTFVNNPLFRQEGGVLCLKEFSFYEVATQSSSEKYAIKHGEYVSPTLLKNRRIRFLFDILANSEQERRTLLNKVQKAFTPENNPSPFNQNLWKNLSFMDVDGNVRNCKCQVYRWIELSDFANEKWVWISVELITDSSYMKSEQEYSETISNTLSWIKLQTKLGFSRKYYRSINYDGYIETPVKIEMQILDTNTRNYPLNKIKVIHQSDIYGMRALYIENINDIGLRDWDRISIDSYNRRCYFTNNNGTEDITGLISLWSERPVLTNGENRIWIDVWVRDHVIDAEVKRNKLF